MFSNTKNNQITTLSHEQAYEEAERMTQVDRYSSDGADVIRGIHPEWGPTVLVFPITGDVLNIPAPTILLPDVMAIKHATADFAPQAK